MQQAVANPLGRVLIKYTGEGWYAGQLTETCSEVIIDGGIYSFDKTQDEFVIETDMSRWFVRQNPESVLVRCRSKDYLVSDGRMRVDQLVRSLNAMLYRSKQPLLPPIDSDHAHYTLTEAAEMCNPAILELHTY